MGELENDIAAYNAALPTLISDAGKYALFYKGKHHGNFDTYALALTRGYELAGISPFLVQQISPVPQIQHFSRSMKFECLISS